MNHTYAYLRNYRKINFRMVSAQHFINEAPGELTFYSTVYVHMAYNNPVNLKTY